jgi:hypothetical protein
MRFYASGIDDVRRAFNSRGRVGDRLGIELSSRLQQKLRRVDSCDPILHQFLSASVAPNPGKKIVGFLNEFRRYEIHGRHVENLSRIDPISIIISWPSAIGKPIMQASDFCIPIRPSVRALAVYLLRRASAPIMPQFVQPMRGPKDGAAAQPSTSNTAA